MLEAEAERDRELLERTHATVLRDGPGFTEYAPLSALPGQHRPSTGYPQLAWGELCCCPNPARAWGARFEPCSLRAV